MSRFASCPRIGLKAALLAAGLAVATSVRADPESPVSSTSGWDLSELMDHLPDFRNLGLPGFRPGGPIKIYARPHLGDFLRRDYVRLPVGARLRVKEKTELNAELESYFTHGFSDSAGYGLSRLRVGAKHENEFQAMPGMAWSWGLDFITPLARPPKELSDGHRHTLPYVSITKTLVPKWNLVGYTGLGADFVAHTALPANFGKNSLHSNSLNFGAGVTREFPKFQAALTATVATSSLISDEGRQVFGLRPDVLIPLTRLNGKNTKLFLTVSGRAVTGPDGQEYGVSSSLRVEFGNKPGGSKAKK